MVDPPSQYDQLIGRYPGVGEAYSALGQSVTHAGPLDPRVAQVVRLGIAIGMQQEGAVHAHTRRALDAGWSADELRHAALLAATTLGWPRMMAAFMWVEDELAAHGDGREVTTEGMD